MNAGKTPDRPIDRLLKAAKALGWNQSELARRLNIPPQSITNWKHRGMPPEFHAKGARLVRMTVEQLLEGTESVVPRDRDVAAYFPLAEFAQLDHEQRLEIAEIVEDRIARIKARGGRAQRRKSAAHRGT